MLQMSMLKHPPAAAGKKVMFKLEDTLHRSSQYSKSGQSRQKQSASQYTVNSSVSRSFSPQVPDRLQNSSGIKQPCLDSDDRATRKYSSKLVTSPPRSSSQKKETDADLYLRSSFEQSQLPEQEMQLAVSQDRRNNDSPTYMLKQEIRTKKSDKF